MLRLALLCFVVCFVVAAEARAHAREAEWRWSASALGTSVVYGDAGASPSVGGAVRWGYGVSNNLELAADLHVFSNLGTVDIGETSLATPGTGVDQMGTLRATVVTGELAVGARYQLSVKHSTWFAKTAPFAGLRVGLGTRYLGSSYLAGPTGVSLFAVDDDVRFTPFVGAELGLQHRFSRSFALGLVTGVSYGGADFVGAQAALELGWHWY